jgi:hypoxanthine-guanine phosphoribosyltransferase
LNQVHTTKGLIDRDLLTVEDIVDEGDNYRSVATEWRLDGELVRRDAAVSILRGHALAGDAAALG